MQGYILASYLYMTIVFVLPLSLGLFTVALNLPVNIDEAFSGLIMPASAYVLLGKSGVQSNPTGILHMSQSSGFAGLIMPASAYALLGKLGVHANPLVICQGL